MTSAKFFALKLCEKVIIAASPESIWKWFESIDRMQSWNSKLICYRPVSQFPPRPGYTYHVKYRLSRTETEFLGEIMRFEPMSAWSARFTDPVGEKAKPDMIIEETYELKSVEKGTFIQHRLNIKNSGIPWFFQLLIKFIQLAGHPVGRDNLTKLKELVEEATCE